MYEKTSQSRIKNTKFRESYLSMSKTALFYSQVLKNKSDAKRHRTYFLNLMAMALIGLFLFRWTIQTTSNHIILHHFVKPRLFSLKTHQLNSLLFCLSYTPPNSMFTKIILPHVTVVSRFFSKRMNQVPHCIY